MKKTPKELKIKTCWCGCDVKFHLHYVEYTGYACTNCSKCNDFGVTAEE
jgi:hypothetical protein